eukprot:7724984-Lingulodinium_polyedra.AAC.1
MRISVLPPMCWLSGALGGARPPGGAPGRCPHRLLPDRWLPSFCPVRYWSVLVASGSDRGPV